MKKITLFMVTLFLLGNSYAQKKAIVNGKITGKHLAEKVYLRYAKPDGEAGIDSASVVKGTFKLSPAITEPTLAIVRIKFAPATSGGKPGFEARQLFLEPGTTTITIKDSLSDAVIKGGLAQKDFEKLTLLSKPFSEKQNSLIGQYTEFRKNNNKEGMEKIEKEFDALDSARKHDVFLNFLKENPKSPAALYALETYAGYDIDPADIEPLYNNLSSSIKNSKSGTAFKGRIEAARKTAVGAIAMNFTQNDTLDKPVSLSDFRGKYVLLDFWASWCGPCRAENPNVVKAFNQYKDKNFTVLGVSLDQEGQKKAWMDAIHKDNLTWTHVSDLKFWNNAVAKEWGIRAIPQNFLIDPSGKIIAKNIRGEELLKKLSEVLD